MKFLFHAAFLSAALTSSLTFLACDDGVVPANGNAFVTATTVLTDRVSNALTVTSVLAIEGSYGSACTERAGDWVIPFNGYQPGTGETPLTVVLNDVACTLSVTAVKVGPLDSVRRFEGDTPVLLSAAFPAAGVSFADDGGGTIAFFSTFRVTPDVSFGTNFIVEMIFSDDINQTDLDLNPTFVVSSSSGTVANVPAPNGTLSLAGLRVAVDANDIVVLSTGTAVLTQGTQAGESLVVDLGTLGAQPDFGALDVAFHLLGEPTPVVSATQSIDALAFSLVGLDITTPQQRSVIVAHSEQGVTSYQVFVITIRSPSGSTGGDTTAPTVLSTSPTDAAIGVATDVVLAVTFSEAMAPITDAHFVLSTGGVPVTGLVTSSGVEATFAPALPLTAGSTFTATLGAEATDLAGNPLGTPTTWTFTTAVDALGPTAITMGTAGNFAVLAVTGATLGAAAVVVGDVGVIAGPLTGFVLVADPSGTFSTSAGVDGSVFSATDAEPTPTVLGVAGADLDAALVDGIGRTSPDAINLGGGDLGGLIITPGLYSWAAAVVVTTDVTLDGGPDDVWIMQMGAAFSMTAAIKTHLTGGAQAKNIYWVVTGAVALGAGAHLDGVVLSRAAVSTGANATVNGRLLGQTAIGIGADSIVTGG